MLTLMIDASLRAQLAIPWLHDVPSLMLRLCSLCQIRLLTRIPQHRESHDGRMRAHHGGREWRLQGLYSSVVEHTIADRAVPCSNHGGVSFSCPFFLAFIFGRRNAEMMYELACFWPAYGCPSASSGILHRPHNYAPTTIISFASCSPSSTISWCR